MILHCKDGAYNISELLMEQWQAVFSCIDVQEEVRLACQWARDNPSRRKTIRGAKRFLSNWLKAEYRRARESGPRETGRLTDVSEMSEPEQKVTPEIANSIAKHMRREEQRCLHNIDHPRFGENYQKAARDYRERAEKYERLAAGG